MMSLDSVLERDAAARPAPQRAAQKIIDVDVHPSVKSIADLKPWLSAEHWEMLKTFGGGSHVPFGYPKAVPDAHRVDARPADGSVAGSDYELLRDQYLEPLNIEYAMLSPLRDTGQGFTHPDLAVAVCRATNEWLRDYWTSRDMRLKASIVVPLGQPDEAAKEIAHWGRHPDFAQVLLLTRTADPLGNRRYWPIYREAVKQGLPVAIHVFGAPGHPSTPGGWPSFYLEEMTSHAAACQAMVASLIVEGVFEEFPTLDVVSLEGGFAWAAPLAWRMDRLYDKFRAEVPHLQLKPSEYLRRNLYFATQPIEEPPDPRHLIDSVKWLGADRLMFSSDYPHWDFDEPTRAITAAFGRDAQAGILNGNARKVYRL
jgi:predicted TIM-barrel fold metal-dependent hydrolase